MTEFQVLIYPEGLALPVTVPLSCDSECLADGLRRVFSEDLCARHAEVWDGPAKVLQIDAVGIAALIGLMDDDRKLLGVPGP